MKVLTEEQDKCVEHLYTHNATLLTVPKSYGKTAITLTAAAELLEAKEINRVLVLAPLNVCKQTWATECDDWPHLAELSVGLATGDKSAQSRLAVLHDRRSYNVVVVNFEMVPWVVKQSLPSLGFDALIIDEITSLSEVGGARFKALRPVVKQFKWRVGTSATSVTEGFQKLYGMALLLDDGATLGRNKQRFLERYFVAKDYQQRVWEIRGEDAAEKLLDTVAPLVYAVDETEYEAELPKIVERCHLVNMPDSTREIYNKFKRELEYRLPDGQTIVAANEAVLQTKLQQLCSGFLYNSSDDRLPVRFDRVKFDALRSILECRINPFCDEKIIIAYQYEYESACIARILREQGLTYATLPGTPVEKAAEAWNAGNLEVLLVHPNSASHGLNLQYGGNQIIFFGPLWSQDKTNQLIGRLRRRGSPHKEIEVTTIVSINTLEDLVIMPRGKTKEERQELFKQHLALS